MTTLNATNQPEKEVVKLVSFKPIGDGLVLLIEGEINAYLPEHAYAVFNNLVPFVTQHAGYDVPNEFLDFICERMNEFEELFASTDYRFTRVSECKAQIDKKSNKLIIDDSSIDLESICEKYPHFKDLVSYVENANVI